MKPKRGETGGVLSKTQQRNKSERASRSSSSSFSKVAIELAEHVALLPTQPPVDYDCPRNRRNKKFRKYKMRGRNTPALKKYLESEKQFLSASQYQQRVDALSRLRVKPGHENDETPEGYWDLVIKDKYKAKTVDKSNDENDHVRNDDDNCNVNHGLGAAAIGVEVDESLDDTQPPPTLTEINIKSNANREDDENLDDTLPPPTPTKTNKKVQTFVVCHVVDCGRQLKSSYEFRRHMADEHGEKKAFVCNELLCGRAFIRKQALDRHQLSKHDLGRVKLTCEHCGKRISSRPDHTARHQKRCQSIEIKKCEFCDLQHKSEKILNRHMAKMHPKDYSKRLLSAKKVNKK